MRQSWFWMSNCCGTRLPGRLRLWCLRGWSTHREQEESSCDALPTGRTLSSTFPQPDLCLCLHAHRLHQRVQLSVDFCGGESKDASVTTQSSRESCDGQAYQKPPSVRENCERLSFPVGQKLTAALHHAPFIFPEGLSSIETLLTNIQGLLRVAIENARVQEKQDQLERTELKMELVRERELRETLERQLSVEQKNRVLIQKRLKKEKRNKRRLQEALEEEVKLRDQAEHTLLHTATTHTGHQSSAGLHTDVTLDLDVNGHDDISVDTKAPGKEGRVFLQAAGMY